MDSFKHIVLSISFLVLTIIMGTAGYIIVEGWDTMDSLYMTVITIASVGFGEVNKVSNIGRIYTIFLILLGGGFSLYVAGAMVQFMVEGQIRVILGRRRLDQKIKHLKNHYIICGYGRIGRVVTHYIKEKTSKIVIVEKNHEMVSFLDEDKNLYIIGDASEESTLIKAGINKAQCLIAALATDIDNVFLVLSARQLNHDIFIMARASSQAAKAKLKAAGANKVESPYDVGAMSMATRILKPTVTNFLNMALATKHKDIQMEEIPVKPSSRLVNLMLKDSGIRQQFNLIIISIKKENGTMIFNPSHETKIESGDTVIAVGQDDNLSKLEKILNP